MKLTATGRITIPQPIRERYGLTPGTEVRFVEHEHGLVVEKVADAWERYRGFLKRRKRTPQVMRLLRETRP